MLINEIIYSRIFVNIALPQGCVRAYQIIYNKRTDDIFPLANREREPGNVLYKQFIQGLVQLETNSLISTVDIVHVFHVPASTLSCIYRKSVYVCKKTHTWRNRLNGKLTMCITHNPTKNY